MSSNSTKLRILHTNLKKILKMSQTKNCFVSQITQVIFNQSNTIGPY